MELKIKTVNTMTSSDGSQYGKFTIEPLERGFGTTIGNALRRVLLSSLEGTAVTSCRIEGITHEYTAIPGVLEDVIDVMLNLKGLAIKTDSKEPQNLRIDVDKPGPVLASDIQLPAGVKVVNPDWLICTIADGGSYTLVDYDNSEYGSKVFTLKMNKLAVKPWVVLSSSSPGATITKIEIFDKK